VVLPRRQGQLNYLLLHSAGMGGTSSLRNCCHIPRTTYDCLLIGHAGRTSVLL